MSVSDSIAVKKKSLVPKKILLPYILLTSCFAWWGIGE